MKPSVKKFFRTWDKTTQWFSFQDGNNDKRVLLEFDVHHPKNMSEENYTKLLEQNSQQVVKLIRTLYPNSGCIIQSQWSNDLYIILLKTSAESKWAILGPYETGEEATEYQQSLSTEYKSRVISLGAIAKDFIINDFTDYSGDKNPFEMARIIDDIGNELRNTANEMTYYEDKMRDGQILLAKELLKQFFEGD